VTGGHNPRRFGLAILANGFARINTTVIQLAGLPLYLAFWGSELYGEWLILTTIPAYLTLSDVGFTSVAQNAMSIRASAGDRDGALRAFQAAFLFVFLIFCLGSAVVAGLVWLIPFEDWLNLSRLDHAAAWLVLVWFLVKLAAVQFTGLFMGIFRAVGQNPRGVLYFNIALFSQFVLMAAGLAAGFGAVGVAALEALGSVVALIVFWVLGKRYWPWLAFGRFTELREEIHTLLRPSFGMFGCTLSFALTLQGSTTLVGVLLGPQAVVLFNTVRTLTRVPQQAVETISNAVWPEFSLAYGAGDADAMRRLYRQAIGLNIWCMGLICLALLAFGQPVYEIWTRVAITWDNTLFVAMLAVVAVNALHFGSTVSLFAINRHERIAVWFVAAAVLSLALAVPLAETFGVVGVAMALVVDGVVRLMATMRGVRGIIDDTVGEVVRYLFIDFWADSRDLIASLGRGRKDPAGDTAPDA